MLGRMIKRRDVLIWGVILVLGLVLAGLMGRGDRQALAVVAFPDQDRHLGVQDAGLTLTFNRWLRPEQLNGTLEITPPLAGRLGGGGRTLTYTFTELPVYSTQYRLRWSVAGGKPFEADFRSHDRAFAYIGLQGSQEGRLMLYNLSRRQQVPLTPPDLFVTNFRMPPAGDWVFFTAYPRRDPQGLKQQTLYRISTGWNFDQPQRQNIPRGRLEKILDTADYENGRFDLAPDGSVLVMERRSRQNPQENNLWRISPTGEGRSLGLTAQRFFFTPDSQGIAVIQDKRFALVPLIENGGAPVYVTGYDDLLAIAPDGVQLASKRTPQGQSLWLITRTGEAQEILNSPTVAIDCQFSPRNLAHLYCLKLDVSLVQGQYQQVPYLAQIDWQKRQEKPILNLPQTQEMQIAPDGVGLLFDQVGLDANGGVTSGKIWAMGLPLPPADNPPQGWRSEELIPGFRPRWFP